MEAEPELLFLQRRKAKSKNKVLKEKIESNAPLTEDEVYMLALAAHERDAFFMFEYSMLLCTQYIETRGEQDLLIATNALLLAAAAEHEPARIVLAECSVKIVQWLDGLKDEHQQLYYDWSTLPPSKTLEPSEGMRDNVCSVMKSLRQFILAHQLQVISDAR